MHTKFNIHILRNVFHKMKIKYMNKKNLNCNITYIHTCNSLPLTMLNDSNVARRFFRLLSLSICKWEWENCKCRICTPSTNISCDSDVTERSKSYTDRDCMGDDISCNVERKETAVVPGHSKNSPEKEAKKKSSQNLYCI